MAVLVVPGGSRWTVSSYTARTVSLVKALIRTQANTRISSR
jgi:hypothetical protein